MKAKTLLLLLSITLVAVTQATASVNLDSTLVYRDAFLPPGVPSIAVRTDETAMLWNPAGLAFSGGYFLGYAWNCPVVGDA